MKTFTEKDVQPHGAIAGAGKIYIKDVSELVHCPTDWQRRGLQQTASGYGAKLNSGMKISFEGRLYRIYVTYYSNAGSSWFTVKGRKIFVS